MEVFVIISQASKNFFLYASAKPEYDNRVYFAGEHVSVSHGWYKGL